MWYNNACPVCRGSCYDSDDDPGWIVCLMCRREFQLKKSNKKEEKIGKNSIENR